MALIKKTIIVESDIWEKVEKFGKEPGQQRAANHQAGVILKEFIENQEAKKCQSL